MHVILSLPQTSMLLHFIKMWVLFLLLFTCVVEGKDFDNVHHVTIKVKKADMNGNNVDMNVLLGKMNGFENLLAAQDKR